MAITRSNTAFGWTDWRKGYGDAAGTFDPVHTYHTTMSEEEMAAFFSPNEKGYILIFEGLPADARLSAMDVQSTIVSTQFATMFRYALEFKAATPIDREKVKRKWLRVIPGVDAAMCTEKKADE